MATPASSRAAQALSEEIDQLLEQYLSLLAQYHTLRTSLATVQSSIHQSIARANFLAYRGIRYGQDLYDQRMQASRTCCVSSAPVEEGSKAGSTCTVSSLHNCAKNNTKNEDGVPGDKSSTEDDREGTESNNAEQTQGLKDSIRMFGILTPQALRTAQSDSILMVENLVPRLVEVDAEMKEVEIKIRRAKKWRTKACEKETLGTGTEKGRESLADA